MRRLFLVAAAGALSGSVFAADLPASPAPIVHNIAAKFAESWEANKDKPEADRLAAFKKDVAPGFAAFYGIERWNGETTQAQLDGRIEQAIKEFPEIREGYLRKAKQFETELPRYIASFRQWFPDYQPTNEIYVLHSLGEMDGGTRTFNGQDYLIFGVDGMVKYHGKGNESAFFHHELFHTYQGAAQGDCGDAGMWNSLWNEGLATYVSKAMNPDANDVELLLDFPGGMAKQTQKVLPAAFAHLETVLDSTDHTVYKGLFNGFKDATGLPPRRGYYLGYLVAAEAAKTHDVRELAKLDCGKSRELVLSTVHKLNAAAQGK